MNWLPNTNPNLLAVMDDGESLVPIIGWLAMGMPYGPGLGVAVTGHPVTVVFDRASGRVFSHSRSWTSLLHYRDDNG